MPTPTLLWYDYETTGTDPVRDRPVQFAALRTNLELQPVGEPVSLFCATSADVLPHPEACLITGLTPQGVAARALTAAEFAGAVHDALAEPGTCSVGYNTIRFDDEVNRNLFHRNFFDPYEHAWRGGNSRWDIMDLARACYALRPAGIEWPRRDDGAPSFKLEHLANANHLEQARAHDAASDVAATAALARLLKTKQPRLYDWYFRLRDKRKVAPMLASALPEMQPLLHVSGRYPPQRGCLAMVAPVAEHPERGGTYVVADLSVDPAAWIDLEPDELVERMFTRREDLPERMERPPLKEVHANKSPFLAPIETLRDADTARIGLDPDRCLQNRAQIRASAGLAERVRAAFAESSRRWPERSDPECSLYGGGFPSDADKRRFGKVRSTPVNVLGVTEFGFDDARYTELLFRYRARNWPATLTAAENDRWRAFVRDKLTRETETTTLTLEQYFETIARLRAEVPPGPKQTVLDQLQDWGESRRAEFGL
ncbi:MAG TPA: exodeoxyribonuclease I [Rhodanobacteraceae bacterium]